MADDATPILSERGLFWWSDAKIKRGHFAPEASVNGCLTINKDGSSDLELDEHLPRRKGQRSPLASILRRNDPVPPVAGILTKGGRRILLSRLREGGSMISTYGPSTQGFHALECLVTVNDCRPGVRPKHVREIEIALSGFEPWLRREDIEFERRDDGFSLNYVAPKDRLYRLSNGKLRLRTELIGPYGKGHRTSVELREAPYLTFTPKEPMSADQASAWASRLEDLFVLLTDKERSMAWPVVRMRGLKTRITIYRSRMLRPDKALGWNESWLDLRDVGDLLGELVDNWMLRHEEFGPGFHLYLGTRRGAKLYLEHRFASLIWGLESLHRRRTNSGTAAPSARVERILSDVKLGDDRRWLRGKLKHASEPDLAKRLFELLAELPFSFTAKTLRAFCDRCAKRRNDVSHFGGQRHGASYREFLDDIELLGEALDVLYHALLLRMIGVPDTMLKDLFERHRHSYQLKRVLEWAGLPLGPSDPP